MSSENFLLRDVVALNYGKSLPEGARSPGEIPVYGSGGITGTHHEALVRGPGIIIGRKGTVGSVFWEARDFFPIDTVYFAEPIKDGSDRKFIYYLLKSLPLARMNSDAAVPGLNREAAYALRVQLPSPGVQRRVAAVLSSYDDLIENNRRRIALLEQSARLLYREWFVHLRFPGHEHVKVVDGVPEGWARRALGGLATLNYGKALKADKRHPGPYPVYGSSGIVGSHRVGLSEGPGIILGRKGNVGSVYWAPQGFFAIDTVYFIDADTSNLYLYHALQNAQFISTDVAVPGLNRDFAYSRPLLWPTTLLLDEFLRAVTPIYQQIDKLTQYAEKLRQARDLLLPRLMSGQIQPNDTSYA